MTATSPKVRIWLIGKPGEEFSSTTRQPSEERIAALRSQGWDVFDLTADLPERYAAPSGTVRARMRRTG